MKVPEDFELGDIVQGPDNIVGTITNWHHSGDFLFAKVSSIDFGFREYYWLPNEMTKIELSGNYSEGN